MTTQRRIGRRRLLAAGLGAGASLAAATAFGTRSVSTIDHLGRATARATRVDPPDPPAPGTYDPDALYVALYGHPGSSVLGALGEQGLVATADRAARAAHDYEGFGRRVVPTFEMIGSVASAFPGADGDYSNEFGLEKFRPYIDIAAQRSYHVLIDLQPGRSDFATQAREYEAHLRFPHVSLALDPEWRGDAPFRPGGGRIGTVGADEVNRTVAWLDDLVRRAGLPPKMLVLHQFTPTMITDKQRIRGTANVQIVNHMDGFGSLELKRASWQRMVDDLPPGATTGWKNFYDEDRPTPTPAQTLANAPAPSLVSFQ